MPSPSWTDGRSSSEVEAASATILDVVVCEDTLTVELSDGRTVSAPVAGYPRLLNGSPEERSHWRLVGAGRGIHWPDLDEGISLDGLLAGRPSAESQESLRRWLDGRSSRKE